LTDSVEKVRKRYLAHHGPEWICQVLEITRIWRSLIPPVGPYRKIILCAVAVIAPSGRPFDFFNNIDP